MSEALIQWFTTTFSGILSEEVIVFIISMVPILELRGGLVAAKLMGIPLLPANVLCIIGNIIPIPFILLFIKQIFKLSTSSSYKIINNLKLCTCLKLTFVNKTKCVL